MSDITFELTKIVVMICASLVTAYIVPYIRKSVSQEKINSVVKWTHRAVWFAQQTMSAQSGADRKAYVVMFLEDIVKANKIPITDEQIEILIESAVKELRLEEAQGKIGDDPK